MYLKPLVDHFNDTFSREHRTTFRPFILDGDLVSGIFGPIRVSSLFTPLTLVDNPHTIIGHKAQANVSTYETKKLFSEEVENLLRSDRNAAVSDAIINFDRLCRTVHLMNYLPVVHLQGSIFLEVDPRHILGVKKDHGAYFEDVIERCGLATKNIVILTALNSQYNTHHPELTNGLNNYRRRGYQVALQFDVNGTYTDYFDFIAELSPHYVCFAGNDTDLAYSPLLQEKLSQIRALVTAIGAKSILKQDDAKLGAILAQGAGFDLIHGSHYSGIPQSTIPA